MHADIHANFHAACTLTYTLVFGNTVAELLYASLSRHMHACCAGAVATGKVLHLLHAEDAASCSRHTGPCLPDIPEGVQEGQHT